MISQTPPDLNLRKVDRYGDLPILLQFFTNKNWMMLFSKREQSKLWSILFSKYFKCCTAMSAYSVGALLRFRHGSQSRGLLMFTFTLSYILVFNSETVWIVFKPVMVPIAPLLPLFCDGDKIFKWGFEDIHSTGLLIYACTFAIASLTDIVFTWIGLGNSDLTKRGNSWIYILISKFTDTIDERLVQILIEPVIIAAIAFIPWALGDLAFAIFLWMGSISMFTQEALDEAWTVKNRALI